MQTLRVGVYQNPPLIHVDSTGQISGFTIDLLKAIAQENNWAKLFKHDNNKGAYTSFELLRGKTIAVLQDDYYSLSRKIFSTIYSGFCLLVRNSPIL